MASTGDWAPLDEATLLREDGASAYLDDNSSPQDPAARGGGFDHDRTGGASPIPPDGALGRSESSAAGSRGEGREVTRDMVLRALERPGTRRRPRNTVEEPHAEDKWMAQQSHLHLNGLHIGRIANLEQMRTLEVLYLYDNSITVIEGVSHLRRLTHLYLSNNAIAAISGLAGLPNLQKLYLEQNCLRVVSGLEACPSLEELHVSRQRLPPGAALGFDPACMAALAPRLRVLAAAGCGLRAEGLAPLRGLPRLRRLDLSHNALETLESVEGVVAAAGALQALDLRGNPLCKAPKYRDAAILLNDSVTLLDDEEVPPQHREFLLRLHIRRMKAQLAADLKDDAAAAAASAAAAPAAGTGGGGGADGDAAGPHLGPAPPPQHSHSLGHGPPPAQHAVHAAGGVAGAASRLPPRIGGFRNVKGGQ